MHPEDGEAEGAEQRQPMKAGLKRSYAHRHVHYSFRSDTMTSGCRARPQHGVVPAHHAIRRGRKCTGERSAAPAPDRGEAPKSVVAEPVLACRELRLRAVA